MFVDGHDHRGSREHRLPARGNRLLKGFEVPIDMFSLDAATAGLHHAFFGKRHNCRYRQTGCEVACRLNNQGEQSMSMMRTLRLSLLVPLGVVATLATACSSSSSPSAAPPTTTFTLASGEVTCTNITGALTFSPPLTTKGGSAESTVIALTAAGCSTQGSNVPTVTGAAESTTISSATNSCTGLLTSRALTIHIAWTPSTIRPSVLTFSGYGGTSSSSGDVGFALPSHGGTAKVTGSFSGTDHGAGSTATAISSQTGTQLLAACGSSAGLTSIQVSSGTVTLK